MKNYLMKGNTVMKKRIGTITAALLAIICIFSGCGVVKGVGGGISTIAYDYEEKYTIGNGAVDASKIKNIELNWISGKIKVQTADVNEIKIEEEAKDIKEDYKLRYLVIDDTLFIQFARSGQWNFSGVKKEITLTLPKDFSLNKLSLNVVSATCDIKGVNIDSFDSDSVSGTISLEGDKFNTINVNTVSGSVDVTGKIEKSFDSSAVSADVTLHIPEGDGFVANFDTTSGSFNSDYEYTGEKRIFKSGNQKLEISCNSVSGRLRIRKAK